jgi:SAM-dependent methyltransferase
MSGATSGGAVSGFATDWLSLREPADLRARDAALLGRVAARFARRDRIVVTDLACGTGATLRALAPHLPASQRWRLVDHDPALLREAEARCDADWAGAAVELEPVQADLAVALEAAIESPADLLTTSAFLDLVSDAWLQRLVAAAASWRRPVYAALTYDGRVACDPVDPMDAAVLAAFDRHQRRDKGLGAALGPAAAAAAARRFTAAGFSVATAPADWRLGIEDSALQHRLLLGWHEAVARTAAVAAPELDAWLARRRAAIADGRSRLTVGHVDLWARPPQRMQPADRSRTATRSTSHRRSSPSA